MKKHVRSISIVAVLLTAFVTVIWAKAKFDYVQIQNQTTHNIGWVNVHCTDNSTTHIDVTGQGNFNGNVSAAPNYATINSYIVYEGQVGYAVDQNNDSLKMDFSQGNIIVVTDSQEGF